ncbi:receptor like protein kinase S.2-like [Rutidosis leptorrhynchoides]|uniref:receptor like protein kinase S.2-like n=1 Tax=Rutidosis leptorrhynchoides TaxID=125765 RepID=UPI003A98D73E
MSSLRIVFQEKYYAYLKIPLSDIVSATQNFASTYFSSSDKNDKIYKADLNHFDIDNCLTTGGKNRGEFSKMYGPVTIKRNINKNYKQVVKGFIADIEMFVSHKHPNIMSLVGFCWEDNEMILVFESYAHHGSLADHLGSIIGEKINLTWKQRIRISLDIAHGLKYFHQNMVADGSRKIRQRMLSSNVLLDEKWNAKIATFRLYEHNYKPEYSEYGWSPKDEIYNFGVLLFEILCGKLSDYKSFESMAKWRFKEGTIKNMVDPNIMEEVREHSFILGPDRRSLDAYVNIAHQCLLETKAHPTTLEEIINSLNRALIFQEETLEHFKIRLSDIKAATNDFTNTSIGEGGYGAVYKAELDVYDKMHRRKRSVAIKRIRRKESELRNAGFLAELDIISRCEHPNIISLLGFCFEDSEHILVFEYAANGSLDDYLGKGKLSKLPWARRLAMCLDIASGLSYLHTPSEEKKCIIHRDIKSGNILLGENLEVKVADFGLSIFHPKNHPSSTISTKHIAGTNMYIDPEYEDGKLKIESDIYSFGVVLFEILSGKLAYDRIYTKENGNGIAAVARQRFKDGKLMEMVDIKIMEEAHELIPTFKMRPTQDSLDEFFKVACKCVAEAQADRPKMKEVINGLKKAIYFQNNRKDTLEISVEDIRLGGENFGDTNFNIEKGYGMYNGEVRCSNETKSVIVKRMSKCGLQPPGGGCKEFEIPFKYKHENVIGLVGYCKKRNESYIVYEYAVNQSLNKHLGNAKLTWIKRLKIGIDIANGLKFLHGTNEGQDVVIHRDLKSSRILLTRDWKAKKIDYINDRIIGSPGYCDPQYLKTGILTKESDIYSFGVILFELFCGRLAYTDSGDFLDSLVKDQYDIERPDKLVFERIKEQIEWESLVTFTTIAYRCLHDDRRERPTATMVVLQLQKALRLQEAYEAAKLPRNYDEIHKPYKTHELCSTIERKDVPFGEIPFHKGKLCISLPKTQTSQKITQIKTGTGNKLQSDLDQVVSSFMPR